MKKTKFSILPPLLALLLAFSSCSSDDNNTTTTTTVEEDQQNIENTMDNVLACLQDFEDGQFSTAVKNFYNIANGEIYSEYSEELLDKLSVFNIDFENLNYNSHVGNYNWNTLNQAWDYSANTTNSMVFLFPSEEMGANNNIELAITSYASEMVSFSNENTYLPKALTGYIKKDNTEIANITLSNVEYEVNNNFSFPSNLDLVVYTAPFTHTVALSKISATAFSLSYDFQNNGACVTSFSSVINSNTSDYANISEIEDIASVEGTVLHQNFEIRYSAQVDNLAIIENATEAQINLYVDAEVFFNNAKIGDLMYNEDANGDVFITIIYQNGTSDHVNEYVGEDFLNQLETIFYAFID